VNRARLAALTAVTVLAVAACTAATVPPSTPTPTPHAEHTSLAASPSVKDPAIRPASASPSGDAAGVEIGTVDPALTHPVLEFRSDGESVVFSSARAADSGPSGAPDLWRIVLPGREPELLWRNPNRDNSIVKIAGDLGAYAFVDMKPAGARGWDLWLLPRRATEAIHLDTHPGGEDVSSLVPSLAIYEGTVVWTAFDRGPDGPVSQLRIAQAPGWEPRTIRELPASEAELWFPSLLGSTLAYMEVHYLDQRTSDERHVYLTSTDPGSEARRLDRSGRATMPVVIDGGVLWKEAEEGFSMFNWGKMFRYDPEDGSARRLSLLPQQWVNYPSAGYRYAAWEGADSFQLAVYDLLRDDQLLLARHSIASQQNELRPHVAGDLLVWMHVEPDGGDTRSELRYAYLPGPRDP
jgi:hypothetical protein